MAKDQDVLVWQLVQASDFFLKSAHSIGAKALRDTSGNTLNEYNTLIKASLNCLFKILRHYSAILDAKIQSILYHKTAHILFKETISSDLALDYCIKGIQICKRNEPGLTVIKLKLQYLNFQIQFQSSSSPDSKKQALSYLNSILERELPEDPSYLNIRVFFSLIKLDYFSSIYTPERKISDLKKLCSMVESNLSKENYLFLQIILANLIELQLLNSISLSEVKESLSKLKGYQQPDNVFSVKIPIQFRGISLLFEVLLSLYEFQFDRCTENIQKVDSFVKSVKQSTLKTWSSRLNFNFSLDKSNSSFPVEFKWHSFKDFSLISYLYCGILCSFKSWEKKSKSDKILRLVSSSLITDSNQFSLTFEDAQNKKAKQSYLQILTTAYQLLSDLIKDKFPALENTDDTNPNSLTSVLQNNYHGLFSFIDSYEKSRYSAYECAVYDNLLPLIQYIFAMIYQRNGMFHKALYHYFMAHISCSKSNTKVNFLSSNSTSHSDNEVFNDPIYADFVQSNMGIFGTYSQSLGLSNEIYMLSTINALPIIQHLIEQQKQRQRGLTEFDIGYDTYLTRLLKLLKIKDSLSIQINQLLRTLNSTPLNPAATLSIPQITISTLCYFYTTEDYTFLSKLNLKEIEKASPLLTSFLYLIMGYTYKNDLGLTELENLNCRVGFYTSACNYSAKACNSSCINAIAQLGYLEIWKIMNHNKNLYTPESIGRVYQRFQHFAKDLTEIPDGSSDDQNRKRTKRVKFV
ncbi:hypothetical protein PICMEDRAFT_15830 [Pichia membranifaciens NRRL Y-2026]|uniref:Uncharacterized protein n=1 Tax=Pichia membranifaciens NRRL Y-2026 TaxID=763406 RepID=A0A1E3NPL9_9ASCO|nr:hypothetical protein PICMEDRAFT_15830 [Pichia membranifaciens NRRL Y-2026]ODQ47966.1 hypothetical protein PICMEDRAFT_15830 [Pichia membranifaciens NRRL Y-2026]